MLALRCIVGLLIAVSSLAGAQDQSGYQYSRIGSAKDRVTRPQAGFALIGGGPDLDEAFRWLCKRARGGDFLILRAAGTDAYNPYIQKLCRVNSVATLVIPAREAANDPAVIEAIAHAEAIFIAGGDQANYIRFWMGTPVQAALNDAIRRGVPLGGTSAGLAVMGEWAYSAEGDAPDDPNLDSKTALMNPLSPRITLINGFLNIPILRGIITDTHFTERERMGRLLVFLARLNLPGGENMNPPHLIRGLGVDQETAMLLTPEGAAEVVGKGHAYWIEPTNFLPAPELAASRLATPEIDKPLSSGPFFVRKIEHGTRFSLYRRGHFSHQYQLKIEGGTIQPL